MVGAFFEPTISSVTISTPSASARGASASSSCRSFLPSSGLQGGKKRFLLGRQHLVCLLFRCLRSHTFRAAKGPYNKRKREKSHFLQKRKYVRAVDLHSRPIYTTTDRALPASRNKWPHTAQNDHRRQSDSLEDRTGWAVERPETQASAARPSRPIGPGAPTRPALPAAPGR